MIQTAYRQLGWWLALALVLVAYSTTTLAAGPTSKSKNDIGSLAPEVSLPSFDSIEIKPVAKKPAPIKAAAAKPLPESSLGSVAPSEGVPTLSSAPSARAKVKALTRKPAHTTLVARAPAPKQAKDSPELAGSLAPQ